MKTSCEIIRKKYSTGFSLVELLVVLIIAVTALTITTAAYSKFSSNAYLKSSTRHIAASLRYTRDIAITKSTHSKLIIDLTNREYIFPGVNSPIKLHNKINLKINSADFGFSGNQIAEFRFAPDGSSSGGNILIASSNKSYSIKIDWLTGLVSIDG